MLLVLFIQTKLGCWKFSSICRSNIPCTQIFPRIHRMLGDKRRAHICPGCATSTDVFYHQIPEDRGFNSYGRKGPNPQ